MRPLAITLVGVLVGVCWVGAGPAGAADFRSAGPGHSSRSVGKPPVCRGASDFWDLAGWEIVGGPSDGRAQSSRGIVPMKLGATSG
jgi:hypothetical protein